MGVPAFFAWWSSRYASSLLSTAVKTDKTLKILYLDFNGGIHPAIRSDPNMRRSEMNRAVLDYLRDILKHVQPDEVYITIDGVAPAAKMAQQRDRRYKSAAENKFKRNLMRKHNRPEPDEQHDFNMISPGTEFMYNLQNYLETSLKKPEFRRKYAKITLNGANKPGEGEHKIMSEIRRRRDADPGERVTNLIYGLDADLIFLALLNTPDNCYLVRENMQFGSKKDGAFYDPEEFSYLYMNISALKDILVETLSPHTSLSTLQKEGFQNDIYRDEDFSGPTGWFDSTANHEHRLVVDYAYICFFLGNDFVPHLPAMKIRRNGLTDLIMIYKMISQQIRGFLINSDGSSYNNAFMKKFLSELARIEGPLMLQHAQDRIQSIARWRKRTKYIKDDYERELKAFTYVEDRYEDKILAGTPGWQQRYNKYSFGIRNENPKRYEKLIRPVCQEYLAATLWILQYYQGMHKNWSYMYDHIAAPTASDLNHFSILSKVQQIFPEDKPVTPFVQLMSVLPAESAHLLPKSLDWYMTNRESCINWMYPVKLTYSYYNKLFFYEAKAKMPPADRELLQRLVEASELSEEEQKRNE